MAVNRRSFSGAAAATNLSADIDSSTDTIPVGATTASWPDTSIGPFVITIARGTDSEEKVEIQSYTSSTLTATSGGRGYDGTTAVSHGSNDTVEVTFDATTIAELNEFGAKNGTVTPAASAVGDSAADGTSDWPAAGDHKHAREAFGTTASASAPGDSQAAGTAVTPSRSDHKHSREAAVVGVLSGTVIPFAGASVPSGYLNCDGSLVSRTTYSALFSAIGTTWGGGDGSTTFALPDFRGRTLIGSGTGTSLTTRAIAAAGGEETHVLVTGEMPAHTHEQDGITEYEAIFGSTVGLQPGGSNPVVTSSGILTSSTGGDGAHNNMQPWVALLHIIKT